MSTTSDKTAGSSSETLGRGGIVVGIDGSPGSNHALDWAAGRVERFGPIRPVAAWRYPAWALSDPMLGAPPPAPPEDFAEAARRQAEQLLAEVRSEAVDPLVLVRSAAGPALVEEGTDANLIVVGTRGRGAIVDSILGSVSCHVVSHAAVPVAVVPAEAPIDDPRSRIIVGIDGSPNSVAALAWAIRNAPDGAVVEAVHAWSHNALAIPEPTAISIEYSETEARITLDRVVAEASEIPQAMGREITKTLEYGDPRSVLRSMSNSADLVVVGAQGHQGVAHLLLGSVATGLVHQPIVATVVVPDEAS